MQTPVQRVMQTYGMMVNLTAEEEEELRGRLEKFLEDCAGGDNELAVQGLQFLRGGAARPPRRKRISRLGPLTPQRA
jgi:hypothetical protein